MEPDYAAHEVDSDNSDYAEQDNFTVDKVVPHRPRPSPPEGLEFNVCGPGYGPSYDTWEPASSFIPRINKPFTYNVPQSDIALATTNFEAFAHPVQPHGA